ncbi:MAG: ribosomal protein large subunit ribosomal protein [Parcubacteria group bacterium]|jgi:large subunit ribosomal protein L13|nr:ribosomal protein large subunit ribosomal protein [Parcubacteria group bacterium]
MTSIAQKVSKQRTVQGLDEISYTIDAKGKSLGRVASDAAQALLGKKSVHYVQNAVLPVRVTIINASKLAMTEKRIANKVYVHYTGYPGGLRKTPMSRMMDKKGIEEVMRKTVDGMIPRNKLRKDRMKRLTVTA